MMKKMVAVMMAVMAGMAMVGCSDTSIAEIQPAGIENTIVENIETENVETEKEIVEKIVYVEKEKETPVLEGILKIVDKDGALKRFMVLTDQGYSIHEYLPEAIEFINDACKRELTITDAFGRFQVSDETGRAVHVTTMIEVE